MTGSLEVVILRCRGDTGAFGSPTWFGGLRPTVASQLSSPTNSGQTAAGGTLTRLCSAAAIGDMPTLPRASPAGSV